MDDSGLSHRGLCIWTVPVLVCAVQKDLSEWGDRSEVGCDVVMLEGGHNFWLSKQQDFVPTIARKVKGYVRGRSERRRARREEEAQAKRSREEQGGLQEDDFDWRKALIDEI